MAMVHGPDADDRWAIASSWKIAFASESVADCKGGAAPTWRISEGR